ncbi:MAG: hypothetical protein K0Q55_1847 [Verrucomicrobia bacterium]|jgi:hypothetical protein|nr:hypothetical protein [Verrucomicrobiota bacterium]
MLNFPVRLLSSTMQNEEFELKVGQFLESKPELFAHIPAGTPLWSVTPVSPDEWLPAYTSAQAGRWNLDGVPTKYFADCLPICLAEMVGGEYDIPACICERWQTTDGITAIDIANFPPDIQKALFEDGGLPVEKWRKSHLCLRQLITSPDYNVVTAIKAPSAYGLALDIPGYTLALDPSAHPLTFICKHTLEAA